MHAMQLLHQRAGSTRYEAVTPHTKDRNAEVTVLATTLASSASDADSPCSASGSALNLGMCVHNFDTSSGLLTFLLQCNVSIFCLNIDAALCVCICIVVALSFRFIASWHRVDETEHFSCDSVTKTCVQDAKGPYTDETLCNANCKTGDAEEQKASVPTTTLTITINHAASAKVPADARVRCTAKLFPTCDFGGAIHHWIHWMGACQNFLPDGCVSPPHKLCRLAALIPPTPTRRPPGWHRVPPGTQLSPKLMHSTQHLSWWKRNWFVLKAHGLGVGASNKKSFSCAVTIIPSSLRFAFVVDDHPSE